MVFGRSGNGGSRVMNTALGMLRANVMIADCNLNIIYMNDAVVRLMRDAESDLKK
jgi:methyl-accepting chemotaxis protein